MMKKLLVSLLAVSLLVGCGKGESKTHEITGARVEDVQVRYRDMDIITFSDKEGNTFKLYDESADKMSVTPSTEILVEGSTYDITVSGYYLKDFSPHLGGSKK